ncbi:MAG: putative DNA binding domain-containing protein [Nitrosopumilus sp.]
MNAIELLDIISTGETSKVQFKREITHNDAMAAEIAAMSNSIGGIILLGIVDKTGEVVGIDIQSNISERVANISTNNVNPPVYLTTEIVSIDNDKSSKVLVIHVPEGTNKPYKDNNGAIWVKQGAEKRRLTDNNEQIRLFQQSGILYLDEMIIPNTSINDIENEKVRAYTKLVQKNRTSEEITITNELLNNLAITRDNKLTLGGLLFFAKNPQKHRPIFCIKAVSFFGNSIGGSDYRNSRDIEGSIPEMFDLGMSFLKSNLHQLQAGQNFNSIGKLEISEIALQELLQNALVHRDYYKNSPIRIMIFDNRVEIVSPGSLPNSLTVEQLKMGNAVVRNNLLVTFCSKMMIYRGFGSGIIRSLENQPNIELINDIEGEQFIVKIPRPQKDQ